MHPPMLSPSALASLRKLITTAPAPRPPVALERVKLPASALSAELIQELGEVVGAEGLSESHGERVLHAAGKGYTDLVRMRSGTPEGAPDAIVSPQDHAQVLAVLQLCSEHSVAVVPFGGGTSVVGGLTPLRGEHVALIALDMRHMEGILDLDRNSQIVTVQGGLRVAELESWLEGRGLTLGHFPQSFQYVSVGGCAATRSVGQESTGYGGFERMVLGLRLATPTGELDLPAVPASAAGPGNARREHRAFAASALGAERPPL
jgi:alkyldihydroxyacetonephosphate synthase